MVSQRRFFLLFSVWLVSFYATWHVFCKYDIVNNFESKLRPLQSRKSSVAEAWPKNSKRNLQKSPKGQKISSFKGLGETEIFLNVSNDEFDIQKEIEKIANKRRCEAVDRVLFVKTHKTGSSTITNILNRFADLRELIVALPAGGTNRFMWPSKFHWTSADLLRLDGEAANVLCNHARYNRPQMDAVMKRNTKYVTILREPVAQFHSSFYYFEFDKTLGLQRRKDPLEDFLKDPDKYLYDLSIRLGDLPPEMNLIQNGMFYDLGYEFLEFGNEAVIERAVDKLASELDLVMLMEYFDESLVLLMRELCWSIDDILYIKMNQMKYKRRTITENVKRKIRNWNNADVVLYDRFNKTFWERVKGHGKEFWEDLKEFKTRNDDMFRICQPREIEEKGFKLNVTVKSLVLKAKVDRYHRFYCQKMAMNEIQYLEYFRAKFSTSFGYQNILKREGVGPKRNGELRKFLTNRIKLRKAK